MILALLLACTGDKGAVDSAITDFPADFLWGAAMAGFQVDPGCPSIAASECEDRGSDWYQWVTDPELVADGSTYNSGDPLSLGPGHYELFDEDFARAHDELHLSAVRVSVEWSRLFPNRVPDGVETVDDLYDYVDTDALAWYGAYLDAARAHGLEPLVTINHYTLPLWLHDGKACHQDPEACEDRGWLDAERAVHHIGLFSGFVARELGDRVHWWATLNEPLAVVLAGYMFQTGDRTNPPGISEPALAMAVMVAMIEGNAAIYDAVHAEDPDAMVGAVPNLAASRPDDPADPEDVEGALHLDYVYNRAFLNGTLLGEIDADLDGVAEEIRPELAHKMDYIGVNYYSLIRVGGLTVPLFNGLAWTDFVPLSTWEEYPEGTAEVVNLAAEYGLPVIITENGTPELEGAADRFLRPTLRALSDAMAAGADVRGYFYWSLIDNYEWNHGMGMDFGLYEVDLDTKARSLRPVGEAYAEIAETGMVGD